MAPSTTLQCIFTLHFLKSPYVQRKQLSLNVFVTQSVAKFEKHFYVVEIVL